MRIGIAADAIGSEVGGDKSYWHTLIRGLEIVDSYGAYTLFLSAPLLHGPIPGAQHMRQVRVRPRLPYVRVPFVMPLAIVSERIDLLHVQYIAPPISTVPVVVSVHDISFERYPQFFTKAAIAQLRVLVPLTIRRATAVLTLSEFSKQDMVRRYGVPPEKIIVTYCAPEPMFKPIHDATRLRAVRERYGTGERFILSVGNLQPRKNIKTLIEAYVRLRQADATRHKLVLVGHKAWLHDDIFAAARASGYEDDLIFTGYVSDEDLVALYNAADLFVYPSIFEGFGLPPLEAMACGTSVVTTNASSLPEVVGDAALTVDPLDVEALASAIAAVADNAELRARLSAQGLERAARFSTEAFVGTVIKAYQGALRK